VAPAIGIARRRAITAAVADIHAVIAVSPAVVAVVITSGPAVAIAARPAVVGGCSAAREITRSTVSTATETGRTSETRETGRTSGAKVRRATEAGMRKTTEAGRRTGKPRRRTSEPRRRARGWRGEERERGILARLLRRRALHSLPA